MLCPDVSLAVAIQVTNPNADANLGEVTEEVRAVAWRPHPSLEDGAHGAIAAGSPSQVLARPPALGGDVSGLLHPVGELAATGIVAEAVALQDVTRLAIRGLFELGRSGEFG